MTGDGEVSGVLGDRVDLVQTGVINVENLPADLADGVVMGRLDKIEMGGAVAVRQLLNQAETSEGAQVVVNRGHAHVRKPIGQVMINVIRRGMRIGAHQESENGLALRGHPGMGLLQ